MAWRNGFGAALLLVVGLGAQDSPSRADVTLTLRIAGALREFHAGETIPIELEFSSPTQKRFEIDDNWNQRDHLTDEFRVDPDGGVSDPQLDLLALGGRWSGLAFLAGLDGTPVVRKLALNDWFRFDEPGTYRVSLLSRSVHEGRVVVPVESNAITVTIVPRDEKWEAAHVDALLTRIDQPPSYDDTACLELQYLGTHAAIDAMIRRFEVIRCQTAFVKGLFAAPDREYVVRQMAGWIAAPDQSVNWRYLQTLAILSVYLDHPEWRPAQTAATKGRPAPRGALADEQGMVDAATARFRAAALAARDQKNPQARALMLMSEFEGTPMNARDALRAEVVATFLDLPPERQQIVLDNPFLSASLGSPAMIPVLRRLSETEVPPDGYAAGALVNHALRRLWLLSPEDARPTILKHIADPGPGDEMKTLGALPDRTLPSLDAALAANLLAASREGNEDDDDDPFTLIARLFERYATSAVESAGAQALEAALNRTACGTATEMVAYLARVDAAAGRAALSGLRSSGEAGCGGRFSWSGFAKRRMSPPIEDAAIEALLGSDPEDVRLAAELLRDSGSASAHEPLLRALESWHVAWKDRADDLQPGPGRTPNPAWYVGNALIGALTFGLGWHATAADLEGLQRFCLTDQCREDLTRWTDEADRTEIHIDFYGDPDDAGIQMAHYYDLTFAGLEALLRQYPKGTVFTLDLRQLDARHAADVTTRVKKMAEAAGVVIK